MAYLLASLGLVLLFFGARLLIAAGSSIGARLGLSPIVIGLTIVAFGTSAPELIVSVGGTWSGYGDMALGNVVGSNVFNLSGVLGASILVSEGGLSVTRTLVEYDFVVLSAVSILCLPIFFTGHRISRWEGRLFLLYYVLYTVSLLNAQLLPVLSRSLNLALLGFLLPLTVLTVGIGLWRHRYESTGEQ